MIFCYAATGFDGNIVITETNIRRGIPGIDIVGLPDGAVRESRDRIRVALRSSDFQVPMDRVLINLSPAGMRKEETAFDLPIALSLLSASGQTETGNYNCRWSLILFLITKILHITETHPVD